MTENAENQPVTDTNAAVGIKLFTTEGDEFAVIQLHNIEDAPLAQLAFSAEQARSLGASLFDVASHLEDARRTTEETPVQEEE